jgi:hypothetical protein
VAWEGNESIILEHKGEAVAAVVPMEEYIQLRGLRSKPVPHPEAQSEEEKAETTAVLSTLSYELPDDLLEAYHSLLNKKFSSGLTPEEEAELARLDQQLDEAELTTPLVQSIMTKSRYQHEKWMRTLNEVITKLRELRGAL